MATVKTSRSNIRMETWKRNRCK